MAIAKSKTVRSDWIKAKIRTARLTSEIEGPLMAALPDLIIFFGAEDRLRIIAKMTEIHEGMVEQKAKRSEITEE